ncbi:CinA family nicotinamide mononucleotide deamidase-related protein [Hydrotalea sandarakina]|jgi:nicotinamide-nucleotide amidase|uniref:CinA-like protein n=1 Tax=Hydrotalea sandarakina TaxID=1004304 RepID=A0A2W7TQZ1_9BACT|nr:CinA family nicotinamide mononucleotide deamidase-related protein [Hydrotalea sandarakina]PZX65532.1 nicotinamide-nucleotide amidase [Hydrotalea sandarakina]
MNTISASIITIGDELLIGQVIDTNSAWMAQALNKIGIPIHRRIAVGDKWDEIWQALDQESALSTLIFITGGLGPTSDDITKPLLCKYFGGKLVLHQPTLQHVEYLFEHVFKRGLPLSERNIKQAEVPDNCTIIKNELGTAPGMLFEKNGCLFFSLPGVPHEMQGLMQNEIIPLLQQRFTLGSIEHRTLLTAGIGESMLAERLVEFEKSLPKNLSLAYLPNYGMVRLRLTLNGENATEVNATINTYFENLKALVADVMITDKDEPLEAVVGRILLEQKKTIGTAESCTGGYISHLITSIPGSSSYYEGSIISYSYDIKEKVLHVNKQTLEKYGAVSEEVVREMVQNAQEMLHTDYAIAVSGIMGPGGATPDKPVGTVWMAVSGNHKIITKKMHFRFNRQRNIQLTAANALLLLIQLMNDKN